MFWTLAIAMLVLTGLMLAWPMLSSGSNWKSAGLALLIAVPLGGTLLYQEVGTPIAMNPPPPPASADAEDFDALVSNLKASLQEREEDIEGWLLLGRSLKSLQRFDEALEALETAKRIAPDSPLVNVELAEAMLFASGNPEISAEIRGMLQSAVEEDPSLQKGLWLLGIDAVQRGEDIQAIEYWERLLREIEPGSAIAASVEEQISLARQRAGIEAPAPQVVTSEWPGIAVNISLGNDAAATLGSAIPTSAALFIIARQAGVTAGPPLGVVRVDRPQFPLQITIDDSHAMLPQSQLSAQPALRLQARLSLAGDAASSPGDWSSEAIEVQTENTGPHDLPLTTETE